MSIISSSEEKKSGHYAADVLYGFYPAAGLFSSLRYTPHGKKMISFLTTLSLFFLTEKTQRKEKIHICLCFKDLALKVPRVLNRARF